MFLPIVGRPLFPEPRSDTVLFPLKELPEMIRTVSDLDRVAILTQPDPTLFPDQPD